jgi:phosphatidate cytidylyltransferase
MTNARFTFLLRLGSSLVLWGILSLAIFLKLPVLYLVLIFGVGMLAEWEFLQMLRASGIKTFAKTAIVIAALFLIGSFFYYQFYGSDHGFQFDAAMVFLFIVAVFIRQMCSSFQNQDALQTIVFTLFGLLYIPWTIHFISKIIFLTPPTLEGAPTGQFYVLFAIVVTKFSDMGAYLVGSFFGRHPFMSHISPKKTWEGFFGAIALALIIGAVMYLLFPSQLSLLRWTDIFCLGALLGAVAVVGDLAESMIKRSTQAKDSSHIIPGIGGILDLIDSLLFTMPVFFFYLRGVMHSI